MNRFVLVVVLAATPTLAQTPAKQQPAPAKHRITCMYDESGKFTKAVTNTPYVHPLLVVFTGRGGDEAWAYTIEATDSRACPAHMPNQR
jgi:hypothetical protein